MVRKTITVETMQKVADFLRSLKEPMSKFDIAKNLNIDYYSLEYALSIIDPELLKKVK